MNKGKATKNWLTIRPEGGTKQHQSLSFFWFLFLTLLSGNSERCSNPWVIEFHGTMGSWFIFWLRDRSFLADKCNCIFCSILCFESLHTWITIFKWFRRLQLITYSLQGSVKWVCIVATVSSFFSQIPNFKAVTWLNGFRIQNAMISKTSMVTSRPSFWQFAFWILLSLQLCDPWNGGPYATPHIERIRQEILERVQDTVIDFSWERNQKPRFALKASCFPRVMEGTKII